MKKRYVVAIGEQTEFKQGFAEDCKDAINMTGYKAGIVYVALDFFPTIVDEYGNTVTNIDAIYDAHGISDYERRLPTNHDCYVDPYKLQRMKINDAIRKCDSAFDITSVNYVVFDSKETPWSDVDFRRIFMAGSIPPDIYDLERELNRL